MLFKVEPIAGDVLDCLLETANPDYTNAESLTGHEALVVRENGNVIFAVGFEVYEVPHGSELHVVGINGTRVKSIAWLPKALEALDALCKSRNIKRLTFMVESQRIGQALSRMGGFMPIAQLVGRYI